MHTDSETARTAGRLTRLTAILLALLIGLNSCQSTSPAYAGPAALHSGNWVRVQKRPPTYFPKGLPANSPTQPWDGSWVETGDRAGSRFFIPAHGIGELTPTQLTAEAQAMVQPSRRKAQLDEVAREDTLTAVLTPFAWLAVGALALVAILHQDNED